MKKSIVIGAGVAGLAVAIRLANKGFKVSVFEKNDTYGGKLGSFTSQGFRFDTGPSLFTMPEYFESLFSESGYKFSDFVDYKKLDSSCKYFFEDDSEFTFYKNKEKLSDELVKVFENDKANVLNYLDDARNLYEKSGALFIENSLHKLNTFISYKAVNSLPYLLSIENSKPLHFKNKKYFSSSKLIQLFDRYATYNGSSPYKTPGMMSMIPHLEQNIGTFFPKGGMRSLVDALYHLALKLNVSFHFNQEVNKLQVKNNEIDSVLIGDKFYKADVVISNMDVALTYKTLLDDLKTFNKEIKKERTSSGVVFYWGIKRSFKQLDLHNIFFSKDYKLEFDQIFTENKIPNDPTIYVNITAKHDKSDAPLNMENWFVMVNVPSKFNYSDSDIEDLKSKVILSLSEKLKVDINDLIVTEDILHPKKIANNTNAYMGALYGTASNSVMSAFNRHSNFSSKFNNLFFALFKHNGIPPPG